MGGWGIEKMKQEGYDRKGERKRGKGRDEGGTGDVLVLGWWGCVSLGVVVGMC